MSRVTFGMAAVLLLLLGATLASPAWAPRGSAAGGIVPLGGRGQLLRSGEIDLALGGSAVARPAVAVSADDPPSPALLVYLGLVLVGSAVAIGVVRSGARREG